ncbi:Tetratricopeptide repeat-containing protein [Cruoricaptor ignavus]|uniref:Tetratricopeptide repeat-containing protein n=1 Tax=Cruoricaptor ignavus TaxID=1118202 RepID=A0A1M6BZK4_9FLAO|nr:tetratricopeptide repeat protein [Cruoricaptor ignavus]SHI53858.1 Tetratricopeptide repeat-containing protein [Cruoricaptor ignavus]
MKKTFLSLAVLAATTAFGQKKEIQAAAKSVDSKDFAGARAQISAAEGLMGDRIYMLEPAVQEQYYYAKGSALMNEGKTAEGAKYLSKINDLRTNKIYAGKSGKDRVYFVGKDAADRSGISGLKEETYEPKMNVAPLINDALNKSNQAAVDAYNNKSYAVAGDKFKETYYLLKAAGSDDKTYLMNAAVSYNAAGNNNAAIEIYDDLIASGYTGENTIYTAKNKKSGKVESFDKTNFELQKKLADKSDYTEFKVEKTPNIQKELYQANVKNLYDAQRFDEAAKLADAGLKKFPNDSVLLNLQGLSYYKSGRSSEFIQSLKTQLQADPNDPEKWYNLGVMQSNDPAMKNDAEQSFQKALQINPNYLPALQSMTFLAMGDDEKAVDNYNALKKAGKTDAANKVLDQRRENFRKAIPYAEKWYQLEPDNLDVVTTLKGLYQSTRNEAKFEEFKKKEAALKK